MRISKLLVTNWFRGVIDQAPSRVLIVNSAELAAIPSQVDLGGLLTHLDGFERELSPETILYDECHIDLCGYRFEYE